MILPRSYTKEEIEGLRRDLFACTFASENHALVVEARLQTHLLIGGTVDAFAEEAKAARRGREEYHAAVEREMERYRAEYPELRGLI